MPCTNLQRKLRVLSFLLLLVLSAFVIFALGWGVASAADEIDELEEKIEDRAEKIKELEEEIQEYEGELERVGEEKQTLEGAIQTLDLSRKKISTDISLTSSKINVTDLKISELEEDLVEKERRITVNKEAIAEVLRKIHERESDSLIETVLGHENLSDAWDQIDSLQRFQRVMGEDVQELVALKLELEEVRDEKAGQKKQLTQFQQELSGKKQVLDQNRAEKDQLLRVTENEESNYQKLLAEKRAAREKFEQELLEFERQLQFALDPDSIPSTGQGVLASPLDNALVTQYFGNTPFAQSGAYRGAGHNGIDFRASQGTPIKAALSGTVQGTGNTDAVAGCYSYGKWVLLRHNNGLSTLYAHLSVVSVSQGETVSTGDIIGYSGNTGYSTGPHLHFGVYASEATRIVRLGDIKQITNCGAAHIPVAPLEAYLNPLDYLNNASQLR